MRKTKLYNQNVSNCYETNESGHSTVITVEQTKQVVLQPQKWNKRITSYNIICYLIMIVLTGPEILKVNDLLKQLLRTCSVEVYSLMCFNSIQFIDHKSTKVILTCQYRYLIQDVRIVYVCPCFILSVLTWRLVENDITLLPCLCV